MSSAEKKGRKVSRKEFVKGAAVGAAGVAAGGLLAGCAPAATPTPQVIKETVEVVKEVVKEPWLPEKWDEEADVVIIGAGGAGLAAAIQAASDGASVLILEKAGAAGGTTKLSGGVMQAAGTDFQKQNTEFKDDNPDKHAEYWIRTGEGYIDEELVRDMAKGAPQHIQWLNELGLEFAGIYGPCHVPYMDESLYADRIHVPAGGGEVGSGGVLIETLLEAALSRGVVIEYEAEVTQLLTNVDGEVVGVKVSPETYIKANKGVILAAGGIDRNVEMAKDLSHQQYWDLTTQLCLVCDTDTGDGIRMAQEVGAALAGVGGTIDFCGKTAAGTTNLLPLFPSFIVNKYGRRFVCEDTTYAYHYRAIFQQEVQLGAPTYMIFGKSSLSFPQSPWTEESVAKDIADGQVFTADTIEGLAELISVNPANLAATLDTWNSDMKSGKDNQFGRETGLEPITGPFYAYKNVSYNLGAIGGVKINVDAQALKPSGEPIPRLFAAGMNSGGWIGPYYPSSGTAIMGTLHWGRKAGANAAKLSSI